MTILKNHGYLDEIYPSIETSYRLLKFSEVLNLHKPDHTLCLGTFAIGLRIDV